PRPVGRRRAYLPIASRPRTKPEARPAMQLCDRPGLSYQIALTKIDKLAPAARATTVAMVAAELKTHPAAHPEIHLTSAEKGLGIAALRATIAAFAEPELRADVAPPAVAATRHPR